MRSRWPEWIITLSILALAGAGVWTLWGDDLRRLVHPEEAEAGAPARPPVVPPAGQAAGPF